MSSINQLAKSHVFHHIIYCLSQAYGCSDHYTRMEGEKRTGRDGARAVGREGGRDRLGMRTRKGGQRRVKRAGESSVERVW